MKSTAQQLTTPAGQRRLLQRLATARAQYDAIVATNPEAAEAGDNCVWHDNFAYEENQRRMHAAARAVHDLRALVAHVQVVSVPPRLERVGLGARVTVERSDTGAIETWTIAGIEDGELEARRVSYTAPFARALLGAEEGETRVIVSEQKRYEVTVIGLEASPDERH
jgi:transcription elongation GreA/GreB family factor